MSPSIKIKQLPSPNPDLQTAKAHHVGSPPTTFTNPWPSFQTLTKTTLFSARFGSNAEKNFVPVPESTDGQRSKELVQVHKPDWQSITSNNESSLKVTWLGHASFLVEAPASPGASRGIRILFDPVFSERTSPVGFMGPKRYTPTPCTADELPEVDIVCISHNHYDHLDYSFVHDLYKRRKGNVHFFAALNNKPWFTQHICKPEDVTDADWWDSFSVQVEGVGTVNLTCTPSQHGSGRTPFDQNNTLWCSWALSTPAGEDSRPKALYFAGDAAYQHPDAPSSCPVFKEIGTTLGPFDIALLPIGLMTPTKVMGSVHATPEQSSEIHKEVKAKVSVGMHYGTVRGGISAQYEDVRDPPRRWREVGEKEGLWAGGGVEGSGGHVDVGKGGLGLVHVGETIVV
ncbi:hypothetical protein MBLNU230_g2689t1 [Neophaeotheca triangularis]